MMDHHQASNKKWAKTCDLLSYPCSLIAHVEVLGHGISLGGMDPNWNFNRQNILSACKFIPECYSSENNVYFCVKLQN